VIDVVVNVIAPSGARATADDRRPVPSSPRWRDHLIHLIRVKVPASIGLIEMADH
jgi:hypothetical protein